MKRILFGLALGFVLGAVVTVLWIRLSPAAFAVLVGPVLPQGPFQPEPYFDPTRTGHLGQESLAFGKGDILLLRNRHGSAIIEIAEQGDAFAVYRWRFRATGASTEQRGTGNVYELYERTGQSANGITVKDKGSDLLIRAGPYNIERSYAGSSGGWLYLDRGKMGAQMLRGESFDAYKL